MKIFTTLYLTHHFAPVGDEIQGSDSGISLQSRDGSKSKHSFHSFDSPKLLSNKLAINKSDLNLCEDFGNLPFDMPKLRRKKLIMEQVR